MSEVQNSPLELDISYKNSGIPKISLGDKVKIISYLDRYFIGLSTDKGEVEQKGKERIQAFEGIVISKHLDSSKIGATITVRKMFQGGGTEKIFVLNSPWIKSIDVRNSSIVRRSKLYYLRERTGKSARLKRRLFGRLTKSNGGVQKFPQDPRKPVVE
jgi:large subunit ribosomal protein L19